MNSIATWAIQREEERLGISLDYLREIAASSLAGILKLGLFRSLARHRRRLPKTASHLARVAVSRFADCGSCVQLAIQAALEENVSRAYLRAVLNDSLDDLPPALREVCEYSRSVVEGCDNPNLRASLKSRYGAEGFTELALTIASAQLYPTLKRAMGHAQSCSIRPVTI